MKKLSLFLLCTSILLMENIHGITTNDNSTRAAQGYYLTEPTPATVTTDINTINTTLSQIPAPAIAPSTNPIRSYTNPPVPAPVAPTYYPQPVPQAYSQPIPQVPPTPNYSFDTNPYQMRSPAISTQDEQQMDRLGCNYPYRGYRYEGQSGYDNPCQCSEPSDQACGDCYCLYCHYRPVYYYTTEIDYVPRYEYMRCCRYVPQYYNVTRCREVDEYYNVTKSKMVTEPYCVTHCRKVKQTNAVLRCKMVSEPQSVTRCCSMPKFCEDTDSYYNVPFYYQDTCDVEKPEYYFEEVCKEVPQYYQELCYREVPQYYEETHCRKVPQYYDEQNVRYVPQYYFTCDVKYCPQYKYRRQCKYIPQYYYKHVTSCDQGGMLGPDCPGY